MNIAAFADHFEAGEPFQVRNTVPSGSTIKFSLARRAEVFTVEVASHVWTPASYVRLAGSFMADGAGLSISEDPTQDKAALAELTNLTADGIQKQNVRLSRLLQDHPRSAALHERAALVLGAAAQQQAATGTDTRLLLCRMTAHLAVAQALHAGSLSKDGELAQRMLLDLAQHETAKKQAAAAQWSDGPVVFGDRPELSIVPRTF